MIQHAVSMSRNVYKFLLLFYKFFAIGDKWAKKNPDQLFP